MRQPLLFILGLAEAWGHQTISDEELFVFFVTKSAVFTVCGVSQTPNS